MGFASHRNLVESFGNGLSRESEIHSLWLWLNCLSSFLPGRASGSKHRLNRLNTRLGISRPSRLLKRNPFFFSFFFLPLIHLSPAVLASHAAAAQFWGRTIKSPLRRIAPGTRRRETRVGLTGRVYLWCNARGHARHRAPRASPSRGGVGTSQHPAAPRCHGFGTRIPFRGFLLGRKPPKLTHLFRGCLKYLSI